MACAEAGNEDGLLAQSTATLQDLSAQLTTHTHAHTETNAKTSQLFNFKIGNSVIE